MEEILRLTAGRERLPLEDGRSLRLLSAREVLLARREGAELAGDTGERALCTNACLLARALERHGGPVYQDGAEVLRALTITQIQTLAGKWAEFDRLENPSAQREESQVEGLKKAWSTRLMSALNGVCSIVLGRCPRNSGRKR